MLAWAVTGRELLRELRVKVAAIEERLRSAEADG
jgi:hypothetical protein